jgi:dTDP-4-amino-4,6-dideoxygalactose transaminase
VRINGGRDRDAAVEQLNAAGIGTGIFYPIPAHPQPHIRAIVGDVDLPVAQRMAKEVISLPVHPQLSQADLDMIVTEVNKL